MKTEKKQNGLRVKTLIQAGNTASDGCYVTRNIKVVGCNTAGWPATPTCAGDNLEMKLKECLSTSGEANWWTVFPGCTSASQCAGYRPPLRQKCYKENDTRDTNIVLAYAACLNATKGLSCPACEQKCMDDFYAASSENLAEWGRCLKTIDYNS